MAVSGKRVGWLGLAALWLAGPGVAGQELRNPSFEQPSDPDAWGSDRAAHWERLGAWFNRETTWTPVFNGECMLAYHHWQIKQRNPSVVYQDVADAPTGRVCSFSIKAFKDKHTNADHVELRIEPYLGGPPLATNVYRMADLKGNRWNELAVTGTPATAGVRVVVAVQPGRGSQRKGALKFDDAVFAVRNHGGVAGREPWRASPYGPIRR